MIQLHIRHTGRFRGFIKPPPQVSGEKEGAPEDRREDRVCMALWSCGISCIRLRVLLNSHMAEAESIAGALKNFQPAAEDTVRVTHQATFLFFSLLKVWLFLKRPNFVELLFFFFFIARKSNQQDYKHQFLSLWTSGSQHVEKGGY